MFADTLIEISSKFRPTLLVYVITLFFIFNLLFRGTRKANLIFSMNTFWNVLWVFPFCGWIVAILYGFLGLCVCATVVGLPIGLGLLQYSLFLFWPHGNAMISKSDLEIITEKSRPTWWKVFALIVQIIYFPFGLINAIFGVTYGFLCLK